MSTSNEERSSQSTSQVNAQQTSTSETPSSADMHRCGATSSNPINNNNNNNQSSTSSCDDNSIDPVGVVVDTCNNHHSSNKTPNATTPATPATKTSLAQQQQHQPTTQTQSPYGNRSSQQQPKQDPTYYPYLRQQHLATDQHLALHQWSTPSNGPATAAVAATGTGANPPTQRCLYPAASGVDKLIWAAMMEDAATMAAISNAHKYSQHHQQQNNNNNNTTPAAAAVNHYLPLGRGIGYLNNARDSQIPTPSNKSELELYRLLERANLLNYFATFLSYGGDDVQQLSDAEEDEFLEIMSLVGMTEKPLHVRRMQKALIEWRETKEAEGNFRRPSQYQYFSSSSHNGNYNGYMDSGYYKPQHHHQQQQQQHINNLNSGIFADSPAPTPTSPSSIAVLASDDQQSNISMDMGTSRSNHHNQVHSTPHDILVGAPKRPRLMDSLHRNDTPRRRSTSKSPQPL